MTLGLFAGNYNGSFLYVTSERLSECERGMQIMRSVRVANSWDEVLAIYPAQEVRDLLDAALFDAWETDSGGDDDMSNDYWPDLHDISHHYGWIEAIPKLDDVAKLGDLPTMMREAARLRDTSPATGYDAISWDPTDRVRLDAELAAAGITVHDGTQRFAALLELYETL